MMMIMIIIVIRRGQRDTNPKKHNTNDLPIPKQQLVPPSQFCTVFILTMMFLGTDYPFG